MGTLADIGTSMKNLLRIVLLVNLVMFLSSCDRTSLSEAEFQDPSMEYAPGVFWFWSNGNMTEESITKDMEAMARVGLGHVIIMEVGPGYRARSYNPYGNDGHSPYGGVNFLSDEWRRLFRHVLLEADRLGMQVNMTNGGGWMGTGGWWVKPEDSQKMLTRKEIRYHSGPGSSSRFFIDQPDTRRDFYRDTYLTAWPADKDPVDENDVRDISSCIVSVGEAENAPGPMLVDADLPEGDWIITRWGFTSDGVILHPSPETDMGLEVDKLSKRGARVGFEGQIQRLVDENRDLTGKGKPFVRTHIDSWESGQGNNWTAAMPEEFKSRRGYELFPYLPVLAGKTVRSKDVSERFRYDFNKTLGEMILDNYAREMKRLANKNGLELSIEGYSSPNEWTEYSGIADEPMGEFWTAGRGESRSIGAAQSAHVYGKNIVGAEAFTGVPFLDSWKEHPGTMKATADRMLCAGINRFMFHRYAAQCLWDRTDLAPGQTMCVFGCHYERTQTWWEESKDFNDYLSRCQYMLRQGKPVADYLDVNAESPISRAPFSTRNEYLLGYSRAQCAANGVMGLRATGHGTAMTEGGLEVKLVVLPESDRCQLEMMEKILELVRAGVPVIGRRPDKVWGLKDYEGQESRLASICDEIWSGERGRFMERWAGCPEAALHEMGIIPDFSSALDLLWSHRTSVRDKKEIYFVANTLGESVHLPARFRHGDGVPMLWWPETGDITEPVAWRRLESGVCEVYLELGSEQSVFVVFDKARKETPHVTSIALDGEMIYPLEVPEITQARYGDLQADSTCVDVTRMAREQVSDGVGCIPVDRINALIGMDPAPHVEKILEVTLADGSVHCGLQHGSVALRGRVPVKVIDATASCLTSYTHGQVMDRTAELQDMIDAGYDFFDADISQQKLGSWCRGGNMHVLEYVLESDGHRWGGRRIRFDAPYGGHDNQWLSLPCRAVSGSRVRILPHGAYVFSKGGDYEFTDSEGNKTHVTASEPECVGLDIPGLGDWSQSEDEDLKFFSGTKEYRAELELSGIGSGERLLLDLGEVHEYARVFLNGKMIKTLWHGDKVVDITDHVSEGKNELKVEVTNLWPNRLIGDSMKRQDEERLPDGRLAEWPEWLKNGEGIPDGRTTFCVMNLWHPDDELLPSGWIGPASLLRVSTARLR